MYIRIINLKCKCVFFAKCRRRFGLNFFRAFRSRTKVNSPKSETTNSRCELSICLHFRNCSDYHPFRSFAFRECDRTFTISIELLGNASINLITRRIAKPRRQIHLRRTSSEFNRRLKCIYRETSPCRQFGFEPLPRFFIQPYESQIRT